MVRPSKPRLMASVLNAVVNLGNSKGSSAREVLSFIRQSKVSPKNLTLQVHRALKHGVNAGLLRHRSGRYKALATLNPTSTPTTTTKETTVNNDQKVKKNKLKPNMPSTNNNAETSNHKREQIKTTKSRRRRRSRSRTSNTRRKSRRSPYTRSKVNTTIQNRKRQERKRKYKNEESEEPSYCVAHGRNKSSVPVRTKRSRITKQEFRSEVFDEGDHEDNVKLKPLSRANRHREPKRKEYRAKSRGRSTSRNHTTMLQARQHPIEEIEQVKQLCDENREAMESTVVHQESHEDTEETHEPNDSNSTLANCD